MVTVVRLAESCLHSSTPQHVYEGKLVDRADTTSIVCIHLRLPWVTTACTGYNRIHATLNTTVTYNMQCVVCMHGESVQKGLQRA